MRFWMRWRRSVFSSWTCRPRPSASGAPFARAPLQRLHEEGMRMELPAKTALASPRIDWLGRVRALAPGLAASAAEIERERRLPQRLLDELTAAGLFSLLVPRPFNGGEVDLPTYVAIIEAIAGIDASTAWCLGQNNVCGSVAAFLPEPAAEEIFTGPSPAILAWGAGFGGRATAVGGG